MLQVFTTDAFARWFGALDDAMAEDVATALDVVEQLGPSQAPPESREFLLWYEHPHLSKALAHWEAALGPLALDLEGWGAFRDYAKRILERLDSPRLSARIAKLGPDEASRALRAVREIRAAADLRPRWTSKLQRGARRLSEADPTSARPSAPRGAASRDACARSVAESIAALRQHYFAVLEAAGFAVTDVPAHSRALRELARRACDHPFRLLYGVHAERSVALFVLGERLDRSFYGDSVRRAEGMWQQYLDGHLPAVQPAPLR